LKEWQCKPQAKYTFAGIDYEYSTSGDRSFVNNKEKISFNYNFDSADGAYQILRLNENEMWLKEHEGTLELHFVSQ
jgi:hypothetical protein